MLENASRLAPSNGRNWEQLPKRVSALADAQRAYGANPSNESGVGPRRRNDVAQSREPERLVCALRHGACGALWTHSVRRLTLHRSADDGPPQNRNAAAMAHTAGWRAG